MKINIEPLLIVYLCFMVLVGCDKNNPIPVPVDTVDKITILSVTPNNGLTDGQPTDFSVMVSYNLYKRQTGTLMIGFNNSPSTGAFVMLPDADKIVNKGSGQHTFNVTATIKDWGTQADFMVYVNLSEDPIPVNSAWIPFSSDRLILIKKK